MRYIWEIVRYWYIFEVVRYICENEIYLQNIWYILRYIGECDIHLGEWDVFEWVWKYLERNGRLNVTEWLSEWVTEWKLEMLTHLKKFVKLNVGKVKKFSEQKSLVNQKS